MKDVKYVLVWGISARHYPQHCGLSHVLHDEDVVQIVKKKVGNPVYFIYLLNIIQLIQKKRKEKVQEKYRKKRKPCSSVSHVGNPSFYFVYFLVYFSKFQVHSLNVEEKKTS